MANVNTTKADLIGRIADKLGYEKTLVATIFEATLESINEALVNNETIQLRGHGTYGIKVRKPKKARVIKRNTTIDLPERKVAYFKTSKLLTAEINKK
ncbi:MAG: integration host factor subunit beta [Bacteroidales bacterium]|nr:integration host factor subunit beta [Bacteroidales bacterium]